MLGADFLCRGYLPVTDGLTALVSTTPNGHTATVVLLAQECGADVNAANEDEWTALMLAAQNRHTTTVVALALQCGVDVKATNKNGSTALMIAAHCARLKRAHSNSAGAGEGVRGRRECCQQEWLHSPHAGSARWT